MGEYRQVVSGKNLIDCQCKLRIGIREYRIIRIFCLREHTHNNLIDTIKKADQVQSAQFHGYVYEMNWLLIESPDNST